MTKSHRNERSKRMPSRKKHEAPLPDERAHELFARFAAPLFRAAKTPTQREGAQRLAQALWVALVTGPEIEEAVFQSLAGVGQLNPEDVAVIKERYYNEMKPSITKAELEYLKERYKVRKR